jgi:hypothetical protein
MTLADKLQIKPGQEVAVLRAPDDVDPGVPAGGGAPDEADAPFRGQPRGLRPVRQIAIDDTWSALRVRPG